MSEERWMPIERNDGGGIFANLTWVFFTELSKHRISLDYGCLTLDNSLFSWFKSSIRKGMGNGHSMPKRLESFLDVDEGLGIFERLRSWVLPSCSKSRKEIV